ncbi:hypothetical protein [Hoylesella timonensis]|uniref:Uncharacterized protein n=1 Tax=Hoylesella timonensis S9-PR14 TaxID=1401062 RepID=A0A098YPG3_9BACT|nr:hypothetical protein [Hoylesella timonensis]KGI21261.1 hypothetical protein HMPREF9304_11225 [Hoylesella timonensis S9-PR14]
MNKVLTRGIITIAAVNDGKDGHSLTAKAFIEGSYRNGFIKGVKNYVRVFYDGQEVTDFKASYRYKGAGYSNWSEPEIKSSDAWCDAQRDGSTLLVEYTVEYKGLKALATGRLDNIQDGMPGKDAVIYKLVPSKEKVLAYFESHSHYKKVMVELKYFIQKTVGDVTTDVRLYDEGLTLRAYPDLGDLQASSGVYSFGPVIRTYDASEETFSVTLLKGNKILDIRTIPITMKPDLVYAFDDKLGEVRRKIRTVDGKVNTFKATINKTSSTVGNLEKEFTQIQQTSKEISMTVNNGTRPNLLWGSDLNLDGVDTTNNAAIEKHLGVGIASTKIDSKEWFEYLKGGGVGGADAIKFKAMKGTSEFAGLFWEFNAGAARNLQLKPNTLYTLSAWVKTEFDKDAQGYSNFVFEAFKKEKDNSRQRVGKLKFKAASSFYEPVNAWTRVSATFTTEELQFGSVAMWVNGTKPATLYICRPKLEEGDTATPWCAYDGTVEALLAGGFDIKNRKFTATADNFVVKNNKGERTFMVDEKGALRSIDTSGKGCIVLRPEVGYISILDSETGKERVMVSNNGIFCLGVKDNNIVFDTGDERGMYAGLDMGAGMFRVNAFNDEAIGMQLDIIMNGLPYTGNNNLQYSQLYVDGKNNLKINTGEPIVKFLHPNDGYTMKSTDTTIVADTEPYRDAKITLPKNPQVGMEVEIINIGTGFCYLETADNTKIFWDEVKTKETVREHRKISLLYVGGSDDLWIYTTEGYCGNHT